MYMRPPPFLTARTSPLRVQEYFAADGVPENRRHARVDQPHLARQWFPRRAVLRLESVRHPDPVRGDRAVRAGSSVWIQYFSDWL